MNKIQSIKSSFSAFNKAARIFICASTLFILSCQFSFAQRFSASAPKSVAENQNFNLSFTLENAQGDNLKLPNLSDFNVLGGPSTSTSMQIMNGSVSQSQTYTYVLRAKKQGTFKIGKAIIQANGNTLESNELTIQVTAPSSQPQSQQQDPYDPFNQQQPQTSLDDLKKQIKDDVFVKVALSKSSVYKGEMLTATYKLYFCRNLSGYNLSKSPSLDGFWKKEVELSPQRRQTVENINGKQYSVLEIMKYNLYPQRSGNLQIAPAEISANAQVQLRSRSNDPFADFFNMGQTQNVPLTLKTAVTSVTVKELPEEGKPKDFAGAVGKFNFSATLSGKEAKTDDAVTYTIKISGEGNLSLIEAPTLQLPPNFESYDPKVKENITNTVSGMSGSKQYDYLIVPRQPGEYKISSQPFSYFDPSSGKYYTITSPEYPIKITGAPSKNPNNNSSTYTNQQDVSLLGEDIRYIKTAVPDFEKEGKTFFGSVGFYALYSFPFLAFIGLIAFRKRNEKMASDIVGSRRRKALKLAKKRLSVAEKHLTHHDKKNFYDEVSRAIWGYIGNKLNIDMAELSKENAEEKLLARNVKAETISKLQQLISTCELSLYAPSSDDSEMKNNYTTALNLIADLEDEIRN